MLVIVWKSTGSMHLHISAWQGSGHRRDMPAQVLREETATVLHPISTRQTSTESPGCEVPQALTVGDTWTQHKNWILPRPQPEGQAEVRDVAESPHFSASFTEALSFREFTGPSPTHSPWGWKGKGRNFSSWQVLNGRGGERKGVGAASSASQRKSGREGRGPLQTDKQVDNPTFELLLV